MSVSDEQVIFITGFPGFIAGRLVERLAADGSRFYLLVQSAFVDAAIRSLERISERSGVGLENFAIVEGDIAYAAWRDAGMAVIDVGDRARPTLITHKYCLYGPCALERWPYPGYEWVKVTVPGTTPVYYSFMKRLDRPPFPPPPR